MGEVVSLLARRRDKRIEQEKEEISLGALAVFDELQKKYEENEERLRKEREKNNKKTLRSYRMKR